MTIAFIRVSATQRGKIIAGPDPSRKAHLDRIRSLTLSNSRQHQLIGDHGDIKFAVQGGDATLAETLLRRRIGAITELVPQLKIPFPTYIQLG